jgi:sulfate permease, SulP family
MARTRYRSPDVVIPLRDLPAAALRAVLREGYGAADLRRDALAGLVVGVVALPLAMALAIAVGVPPQQGLYTSIVAGLLVALLGGSRVQVTGPTAAFIVILAPIYVRFGLSGLLLSGLLSGILLVGMGLLRFGKFIEFIPHPVTTGFTAGIATVIAFLQIKDLLGLSTGGNPDTFWLRLQSMFEARHTASWAEASIGGATLLVLVFLPRITRKVPAPLVALPLAALGAVLLRHLVPGLEIATIATRFHTMIGGKLVAGVPQLPPLPMLPWNAAGPEGHPLVLSFGMLRLLLPGAFAVAMLGAIESLLSAVVADGMAGTRHDPDAELLALGVGNLVVPFFGGIPATGAIARTATNLRYGARSPIAAAVHALVVLLAVLTLAPLIGTLPMSALAALLLVVAWNMADGKLFLRIVRVAPRSDVAVLLVCYALTVTFDMVVAVSVGVVLAALIFMQRMAASTEARPMGELTHPHLKLPDGIAMYEIAGPLFFGAAERAMAVLGTVGDRIRVVILRMEQVSVIDSTGLVAFESALGGLARARCLTIVTGLHAAPAKTLGRAGLHQQPERLRFAADLDDALRMAAEDLVANPRRTKTKG